MIEKLKRLINRKWFHICIMIIIVTFLIISALFITIKYNVEGETNMPFNLSKITVISSSEGKNKENGENKWDYYINQNNDVYLYIEKNKNFDKEAIIEKINIENIKVEKKSEQGTINIYKPEIDETKTLFENKEENKVQTIEYTGDLESNIKNLKISNQGGMIVFRCANDNVAEYNSNEEEEININGLLKKVDISEENLQFKLSFDVIIKTRDLKEYKAEVSIELPAQGIKENDVSSNEEVDLKDVVFKRIKN